MYPKRSFTPCARSARKKKGFLGGYRAGNPSKMVSNGVKNPEILGKIKNPSFKISRNRPIFSLRGGGFNINPPVLMMAPFNLWDEILDRAREQGIEMELLRKDL